MFKDLFLHQERLPPRPAQLLPAREALHQAHLSPAPLKVFAMQYCGEAARV